MNYIKRLQTENIDKTAIIAGMREVILDLQRYLLSDKFKASPNDNGLSGYVNINDVLKRTDSALELSLGYSVDNIGYENEDGGRFRHN